MWREKPYSWELRLFALFLVGWMRLDVYWVSYYLALAPSTVRRWMEEEAELLSHPQALYREFRETTSPRKPASPQPRRLAKVIQLFPPRDSS